MGHRFAPYFESNVRMEFSMNFLGVDHIDIILKINIGGQSRRFKNCRLGDVAKVSCRSGCVEVGVKYSRANAARLGGRAVAGSMAVAATWQG